MATAAAATAAIATLYSSLQERLEIVSHLNPYAGYIKIAAAQNMSFTTPPLPQTKFCMVRLTSGSKLVLASPAILMQ